MFSTDAISPQPRQQEYGKIACSHPLPVVYTVTQCNITLNLTTEHTRQFVCLEMTNLCLHICISGYVRLHIAGSVDKTEERRPWSRVPVQQPAWELRTSICTTTYTTHSTRRQYILPAVAEHEQQPQHHSAAPTTFTTQLTVDSDSAGGF